MKKLATLMTSVLLGLTITNAQVDCDSMSSQDSKKLCKQNKKILRMLRKSSGTGKVSSAVIKLYYDDGKCNASKRIGTVLVQNSYSGNEEACSRATISSMQSVWGYSFTDESGETTCHDISDERDAKVACTKILQQQGRL